MIDLSKLQIPTTDVAPEPTAEDWRSFPSYCQLPGLLGTLERRWLMSLARRCRELEDEMQAVAESTGCKIVCREGGGPENISGTLALSVTRLKAQKSDLEAEVERLRKRNLVLEEDIEEVLRTERYGTD